MKGSGVIQTNAVAVARLKKKRGAQNNGDPNAAYHTQTGAGTLPLGMKKGEELLLETMELVFAELTDEEVEHIKPKDVFRLCTITAVKARNFNAAMSCAERWAPYEHARLASQNNDEHETKIVITGGLPSR